MDGLLPGGGFAVIGVGILVWADVVRFGERRLLRRLTPIAARVTDKGINPRTSIFVSTDANGARTERIDTEYEGWYEYRVDSQTHVGSVIAKGPVFTDAEMPPNAITVFYDRANPAISRLRA